MQIEELIQKNIQEEADRLAQEAIEEQRDIEERAQIERAEDMATQRRLLRNSPITADIFRARTERDEDNG